MKEIKKDSKRSNVYCLDLEKTINRDGCYDAKGSTICRACSVKPPPQKAHEVNEGKTLIAIPAKNKHI